MKVLYSVIFSFIFGCCCVGLHSGLPLAKADMTTKDKGKEIVRDYYVKGMFCGGCAFGVKKALQRVGIKKDQILDVDYSKPDPENKIGHAKIRFEEAQYKGRETDCKIIKEIRDNPGYIAYWDAKETDPCKLNEKKN